MDDPLVSIICTADVTSSTLSNILDTAYRRDLEGPPSLILLSANDSSGLSQLTEESASQPPIVEPFASSFTGMAITDVALFLHGSAQDTVISTHFFFIADAQTATDQSLLLVQINWDDPTVIQTVRVAAEHANREAVSLTMGITGVNELRSLVDEDGIYRGGPPQLSPFDGPARKLVRSAF
ncbi:hypothetical protein BDV28DRAFT_148039 [Aspergillus coremiiformis]|uniref:DUF6924 domain-containing protein n=1 Tax=Aspergillus coremiiformis TaxID=138285 RepID=A0A5N6ZBN3_9EURO|nr:hypothetical protein BDV28DRAFT_148039 [Aspergillus coremiiformis]